MHMVPKIITIRSFTESSPTPLCKHCVKQLYTLPLSICYSFEAEMIAIPILKRKELRLIKIK